MFGQRINPKNRLLTSLIFFALFLSSSFLQAHHTQYSKITSHHGLRSKSIPHFHSINKNAQNPTTVHFGPGPGNVHFGPGPTTMNPKITEREIVPYTLR